MKDLEPLFHRLSMVAPNLNSASDVLTNKISAIENRLAQFNIGLEVWCAVPDSAPYLVGYARTAHGWQLVVRRAEEQPQCLREAARGLRIASLYSMPALLAALADEAEKITLAIETATESTWR